MGDIKTPFNDAVSTSVPTRGSGGGTYDDEPNLPSGMPGRDGGMLPEKHRESITAKVPNFVEVGKTFKIG